MKKFFISFSLIFLFCVTAIAQDYKTHKVKAGETIESIAKIYLVTPYDIYALNPDAKTNFQPNIVLIIPKSKVLKNPIKVETQQLLNYKTHKVKRKETLYSISKKYNITIDDIKKHNTRLYSDNLRKGDRINIPRYKTVLVSSNVGNTIKKYKVLPKEGKWRVAYKFGITVAELEKLNPDLGETLQEDEEINVPNIANNEEKTVEETFGYYTVLPKEGFFRLKIKLGLTQDQLETLNPELADSGLKEGMILKVPLDVASNIESADVERSILADRLNNFETKRIAVMLPFRLNRVDLDSVQEVKDMIRKEGLLSVSLDFHTGVLMALDSAKQLGISTKLDVYDTRAQITQVTSILSNNDFCNYDAVIGPFTANNFERAASMLKSDNVPIISPVTKPEKLYNNVFQTIPSDELLRKKIIQFVKSSTDTIPKHILIISDSKHRKVSDILKREFPTAKQIFSRKDEDGNESHYILLEDIEEQFKEGLNIVFLETENEGFVSNVSSMINGFNGVDEELEIEREIILMTTNKNKAFEGVNISNYDLSKLKFHYPSVNRAFDIEKSNSFVTRYKRVWKTEPNKYAIRGFDLTMDVLLRLAIDEDLYKASNNDIETEYVENKFRYSKKLFGGYYNEAVYIVKYDELKIVEAKQ
ncbi:MAG: LysM peptidoglycan-binding domain-containing protein [Flavobacteriaceae bacterium]|nr:LysM peptidoglycan-binding domain-containing protein [Flavobacteriaceae bacterium]